MKAIRANGKPRHTRGSKPPQERGQQTNRQADRGIQEIATLERSAIHARSPMDRVATSITRKAGSAPAVLFHAIWFGVWVVLNLGYFGLQPFDPYPFGLLTTIVSLEAIFLTLFVLISQNRMSREADRRAELDLQVNVLAEKEATMILRILHEISSHLGLGTATSKDLADLLKETKLAELHQKLQKTLPTDE